MNDARPTLQVAFDTATDRGTVALAEGDRPPREVALGEARTHARTLVPALEDLLRQEGRSFADVTAVVVGAGPGSFTGVRVAAATAKALVHVLGVPLLTRSSLEAAAWGPGWEGAEHRLVLFDARGERVFWTHMRARPDGLVPVVAPVAGELDDVRRHLAGWVGPLPLCAGSGALRHRALLEASGARVQTEAGHPTAAALVALARLDPDGSRVENPARWQPEYLKPWTGRTSGAR